MIQTKMQKKNRVEPHPSKIRTFKSWGNVANEVIFVQLESVGDEREIKHRGAISKIMAENFSKHKLWHSLWDRNYEPKNLQGYQIHTRAHTHTHTFRHSIQIFKQDKHTHIHRHTHTHTHTNTYTQTHTHTPLSRHIVVTLLQIKAKGKFWRQQEKNYFKVF